MPDLLQAAQVDLDVLLDDLRGAHAQTDAVVAKAPDGDVDTPAQGWNVRDTIAHLVQGEELAALAVERPDDFRERLTELLADLAATLQEFERWSVSASLEQLVARWAEARDRLRRAMSGMDARTKVPWVVGDMSAGTFVRSRLMESWAHGLDIADGLGVDRDEDDRQLRHLAYLGLRTRAHSFRNRGLEEPNAPFRLELTAPSGITWTAGDEDADEIVRGTAWDFAAIVTQRRHPDDTEIEIVGPGVRSWLDIAQCFAGPPTEHRAPGSFVDGRWTRRAQVA